MDVFGGGWSGYVDKLQAGFSEIGPEDTVVLCGDLSWGMGLEQARKDFAFLDALPGAEDPAEGQPRLLVDHRRQNGTAFFAENGFSTLEILHNTTAACTGDVALCGTRGWFYEEDRGSTARRFQPGADPAGGLAEGGGGSGRNLLSPLSAPLSGLPLPGDHRPAGAV